MLYHGYNKKFALNYREQFEMTLFSFKVLPFCFTLHPSLLNSSHITPSLQPLWVVMTSYRIFVDFKALYMLYIAFIAIFIL